MLSMHGRIAKREMFRQSSRITVNKVTFERFVESLYNVNILWQKKNVFPEARCISLQYLIYHCDCFQKRWTFKK